MNKRNTALGSLVAVFLSLFFSGIVLFAILVFFHISRYEAFLSVLVFASINLLIIVFVAGFSTAIAQNTGVASFASICTVTGLYTLFQFVYLIFNFRTESSSGYILYQLITLFIYFLIVLSVGIMGSNLNKRNRGI